MRLDLQNKKWKEFVFEDIFDIDSTSSSIDRNKLITKAGEIPYITRSEKNNGYDSLVGKQSEKYGLDQGNVITIGLDTQSVFYQPKDFYTGQNIQILKNQHLNKNVAQFLIPLIKRQMSKFNWGGNGATLTRLRRNKILLPADSQGNPDYAFMESFMTQKEQERLDKYKEFIGKRLSELQDYKEVGILEDREWREFEIQDIFEEMKRGKRLKKADHKTGRIPYISSTSVNNGVDGFIGNNQGIRIFKNCLTIANSGSVGASFYHSYLFVASDHVTKLENNELSEHVYKFISVLMNKMGKKYSFNREINDARIKREKIILPVNQSRQPDYEFMENYMKKLEYQKIQQYVDRKIV